MNFGSVGKRDSENQCPKNKIKQKPFVCFVLQIVPLKRWITNQKRFVVLSIHYDARQPKGGRSLVLLFTCTL